jgi:integrase
LGHGPDGRPKRKEVYGHTPQEVQGEINRLLYEQGQGIDIAPKRLSVAKFLWDWLDNVKRRSISDATYVSYEVILRCHLEPAIGHYILQELQPAHIDAYITRKLKTVHKRGKPYSSRSVQYDLSLLRSALKVAEKRGLVHRNVAELVDAPRVEPKEMRPLTLEQTRSFLAKIKDHPQYPLYLTMLTLGLRRGEVLGLRWEDLDLGEATLDIRAGLQRLGGKLQRTGVKTKSSRRTISLPTPVADVLRAHLKFQEEQRQVAGAQWKETGYIFTTRWGTPMEPRNLNRQFSTLLKNAGLPHFRVHDARHTAATVMRDAGIPIETVSRRLGHSRISTTTDIYVHPQQAADRAAADTIGDLFSPKTKATAAPGPRRLTLVPNDGKLGKKRAG